MLLTVLPNSSFPGTCLVAKERLLAPSPLVNESPTTTTLTVGLSAALAIGPNSAAMPPSASSVTSAAAAPARRMNPGLRRAAASLARAATTVRVPPADGTVRTASTRRALVGAVAPSLQLLVGSTRHALLVRCAGTQVWLREPR